MSLKQKLHELTGVEAEKIPSSPQIIGSVLLAKFLRCTPNEKQKIAKAYIKLLKNVKTVGEIKRIKGALRQPKVVKLAGNGFVTTHKEHGLFYKLDASKIMFSKGNHFERQRLLSQIKPDETVIDMFAGIGYFSLGIAKKAKHVIAIEKNELSFDYLLENIKLNKIKNITAINDDCRKVALPVKADRILMGYYPKTEQFLETAKRFAKKGAIIHYHNTYHKDELWQKPLRELKDFKILSKKIVKSTAPNTYHVVVNCKVK